MPEEQRRVEGLVGACLERGDLHGAAAAGLEGYGQHLMRYLRAVLQDDELAFDAFGDLGERIWKGLKGFRRDCSFRTWVYRLAWSVAQDVRRNGYRRHRERLDTSELSKLIDSVRATTPFYLTSAAERQLDELKQNLTLAERSLLVLRFEKGLPWHEVARVMSEGGPSLDEDAVKKRFRRLKLRLRKLAGGKPPLTG